jgi:hypothetical protein
MSVSANTLRTATGAIAFDKLAALEDRPAAVEHHLSADEALLKLQAIIGRDFDPTVIDGTGDEYPSGTHDDEP